MEGFFKTSYDETKKVWSGLKSKPKYGPHVSIGEVALEGLMQRPEHIGQICYTNGKQYTNQEIATFSIRVAQRFAKLQMEQCDIIGLCASNSDYVAPLFFGAMLSGLTVSTLDISSDKDGIKHIYGITRPKFMFCDGAVYPAVKEAFKEINLSATIYTMNNHIEGVPQITEFLQHTGKEAAFKPQALKMGLSHVAAILCSSGTTGLPKGVSMSHAALLASSTLELEPDHKLISFSTLYWLSGLMCLLTGTFGGITRIISDRGFSPEDYFDIIEKYKASVAFTPPSQIAMSIASPKIKDYDLSSMLLYFSGGSAVPYTLVQKMKQYMPNAFFGIGYGMSEISGGIGFGEAAANGPFMQLSGDVEVKVINENGEQLGPGESGEICIKTSYPWAGYYGNAAATEAIYLEGWVHSGDIGYIDRDGNVFVVDRIKDIYKYNNFHFSPSEIENVIAEMADVAEVCVCAIPDIVATHLPAAAIVKVPGCHLTEREVYKYAADKLANFKHLRGGVYFLQEIPKTASGKNLRRKVTEICENLRNSQIPVSDYK